MSKEFVEKWYSKVPELERDLPIILVDGVVYTPREIYTEVVVKGSELGEKLQAKLEEMHKKATSSNTFSYEDLREIQQIAYERVKRVIDKLPKGFSLASFSGRIVSGRKIMTVIGKDAIKYEMKKIMKLLGGDYNG